MAKDVNKIKEFHFETLPRSTKKALDFLSKEKWLDSTGWYLAGGTALALSTGLRKSVDLDFFTTDKDFTNEELLANFEGEKYWEVSINRKNTVYGVLLGAKVSFIAYPFFVPMQEKSDYGFVKVLKPLDIAVMKIIAISQRGRKRDFFDLYWCVHNLESLESLMARLKVQYPAVAHDYHHILKSLVYFEDAESDPDPELNFKATWTGVKRFFRTEVPAVMKSLLKL